MERDHFPALQKELEASPARVTIMEGPGSLAEGCCFGLHLPALAARLDAPVLLIHLWQGSSSLEPLFDALLSPGRTGDGCGAQCRGSGGCPLP